VTNHLADAHTLAQEHGVLARQLGALQTRWTLRWQQQENRLQQLEGEVVRLRGRLLQARTAQLWGLVQHGHPPRIAGRMPAPIAGSPVNTPAGILADAASVICQTGCAGHAHPWRTAEGLCQRTGDLCHAAERLPVSLPGSQGPEAIRRPSATDQPSGVAPGTGRT
jgi:hypothetical protein